MLLRRGPGSSQITLQAWFPELLLLHCLPSIFQILSVFQPESQGLCYLVLSHILRAREQEDKEKEKKVRGPF